MSDTAQNLIDAGVYVGIDQLLHARHWARDLKLFSRQAARSMLLGETRSRFRGRGMEFEEVRRYQAGDDIRTIDWRVSARTGDTYTKLFCEERERPVHILVDQRSANFFGSSQQFKSVLAAELAAALAWAALAGSDRIGGQIIGDHREYDIRAKRNKQAVLKFIHDLCELNQSLPSDSPASNSLALALKECRRITRPGTAIFIISDFHDFDAEAAKALSNLGRHCDIQAFHVCDPLEESLPLNGMAAVSDGKQQSSIAFSNRLRSAYQEQRCEQYEELNKALIRSRALYAKLSTNENARNALSKIFGK